MKSLELELGSSCLKLPDGSILSIKSSIVYVITILQKLSYTLGKIDIESDAANIYLTIVSYNISLTFDRKYQRLLTITLKNLKILKLTESRTNIVFCNLKENTDPSLTLLSEIFGATKPGNISGNVYQLGYPGVTFCFPCENGKIGNNVICEQIVIENDRLSSQDSLCLEY